MKVFIDCRESETFLMNSIIFFIPGVIFFTLISLCNESALSVINTAIQFHFS